MKFTYILAALAFASPAFANSHGNEFVHSRTNNGQVYMMYQTHMSLYTLDNDPVGTSTCYGECAQNWPPALLPAGTPLGENYSLIARQDGTMQAAFKGHALYLSALDTRIGETNGDGVDGIWWLARPDLF